MMTISLCPSCILTFLPLVLVQHVASSLTRHVVIQLRDLVIESPVCPIVLCHPFFWMPSIPGSVLMALRPVAKLVPLVTDGISSLPVWILVHCLFLRVPLRPFRCSYCWFACRFPLALRFSSWGLPAGIFSSKIPFLLVGCSYHCPA